MTYVYKPFELEAFVSKMYQQMGIFYPEQINEDYIAAKLGIELVYSRYRSYADEDEGFKIINIHKYLDPFQKREIFFHELGHLLRHGGDQTEMTQMFRDWQERDAKRFTQYAAIPYHMLRFIDFTLPRQHILLEMRETFRVPESLCQSRLEQIERNTRKSYAYIE
ncbi:ImmA/IrrE family metallo-endopeptidase [Parageobacillus sp. KH3-4]|uniref:ImmA/IrrE family metallo-endopeptidase n=1 Tax=Parageobacillus sp. KH3-4 TaxID=2916802 RepID=UPI001FCB2041|nr:ImmA/IrrE family metallo-endopeptidase [Parageobacillus sp. KH3-4]BDG46393.1 hypothetical protein PspKH34_09540 [Parageobacillus sp. KH3-4]